MPTTLYKPHWPIALADSAPTLIARRDLVNYAQPDRISICGNLYDRADTIIAEREHGIRAVIDLRAAASRVPYGAAVADTGAVLPATDGWLTLAYGTRA